jgi:hypothetical protein
LPWIFGFKIQFVAFAGGGPSELNARLKRLEVNERLQMEYSQFPSLPQERTARGNMGESYVGGFTARISRQI